MPFMSINPNEQGSTALSNILDAINTTLGTAARTAGNLYRYGQSNPEGVQFLNDKLGWLGKFGADIPYYDPSGPIPVRAKGWEIADQQPMAQRQVSLGGQGWAPRNSGTVWYEAGKGQDVLPQQVRRWQMDQTPGFNQVLQDQFAQNPGWRNAYAMPLDPVGNTYLNRDPGNPRDMEKARTGVSASAPAIDDPRVQAMNTAAMNRIQPQAYQDARLTDMLASLLGL